MSDALPVPKVGEEGFWDGIFPTNLTTIDGFNATFNTTLNGTQVNLNRRSCKITVEIRYSDGTVEEADVAAFLIESIQTDSTSGQATLNLTTLVQPLMESDAEVVKNGQSWYQNRPVGFLVSELMKSVYADPTSGNLPTNYIIPTIYNVGELETNSGVQTISSFGRPPEFDNRKFLDLGLTCRATASGNVGEGTRIYLGCDNELWAYNPSADSYTKCGALPQKDLVIRQMYIHSNVLYGVAYVDLNNGLVDGNTLQLCTIIQLFTYSFSAGFVSKQSITNVWPGEWQLRRGTNYTWSFDVTNPSLTVHNYNDASIIGTSLVNNASSGNTGSNWFYGPMQHYYSGGENIPIPFLNRAVLGYGSEDIGSGAYTWTNPNKYKYATGYTHGELVCQDWTYDSINYQRANLWLLANDAYMSTEADCSDNTFDKTTTPIADGPGYLSASITASVTSTSASFDNTGTPHPVVMCRHPLGNRETMCFFTRFGSGHDHIALLYFKATTTGVNLSSARTSGYSLSLSLMAFDLINSTEYTLSSGITDNSWPLQPTSIFVDNAGYDAGDFEIYFSGMAWDETGAGPALGSLAVSDSYSCLYAYKMAVGGTTLGSSNATKSGRSVKTVVSGIVNRSHSGKEVQLCYLDRSKCSSTTTDTYTLAYTPKSSPDVTNLTTIISSPYMFGYFLKGGDNKTYFLNLRDRSSSGGDCQLWSYNGTAAAALDDGRGITLGEANESAHLCYTTNSKSQTVIWGVSAPYFPAQLQRAKTTGKYWLWKYDSSLSNRVEVADFSGLKVWDTLVMLANANRCVVGFDLDRFFFVKRLAETTPTFTFDADYDPYTELNKTQDRDIRNVIKATPSVSKLGDIEYEIVLKSDATQPTPTSYYDGELGVSQLDTVTKTIRMRCAKSGWIQSTEDADTIMDRPLFGFLIHDPIVELRVLRDSSSTDTRIFLPTIYETVEVGDYILVQHPTTKLDIYRRVTAVDLTNNYIDIDSSLGVALQAMTPLIVIPGNVTSATATPLRYKFSNEGITYVTSVSVTNWSARVEVISAGPIGVDSIVSFGDKGYYYTVMKKYEKDSKWVLHVRPLPVRNLGGSDIQTGDVVKAYFQPAVASEYREIGDSNVEIAFYPSNGSDPTRVYFSATTTTTDSITITCPGLSLVQEEQSKYTAVDVNSIALYGKREYEMPDNRFIHHSRIGEIIRNELSATSHPRLLINVTLQLTGRYLGATTSGFETIPFVNSDTQKLTMVRVISSRLFKGWSNNAVDCYIIGQSFNPKTLTQKFQLRSVYPF